MVEFESGQLARDGGKQHAMYKVSSLKQPLILTDAISTDANTKKHHGLRILVLEYTDAL